MKQESIDDCVSCRMDFPHLSTAIDLNSLAAALRPLVGVEFDFRQDELVECMVASWNGHEVIIAHPLEAVLPEYACGGQLTENNAATSGTKAHCVATMSADSMSVIASVSTELL